MNGRGRNIRNELRKLTCEKLHAISDENKFRVEIIIPLLQYHLGASHVYDMHGPDECGIDVYFQWPDIFGHPRRFGMQLKTKPITSKAEPDKNSNIRTICNQIQMAFGREIILPCSKDGKVRVTIDGYYVVTSKTVNSTASEYILESRKTFPFIQLLEGRDIIDIIQNNALPLIKRESLTLLRMTQLSFLNPVERVNHHE